MTPAKYPNETETTKTKTQRAFMNTIIQHTIISKQQNKKRFLRNTGVETIETTVTSMILVV